MDTGRSKNGKFDLALVADDGMDTTNSPERHCTFEMDSEFVWDGMS